MSRFKTTYQLIFVLVMGIVCSQNAHSYDIISALPADPIIPEDNPLTPEKVALGKKLFFDARLSLDGTVSCNSCHHLMSGGDDDGAVNQMANRNINRSAPSVWNVAYMSTLYWDGRAKSLESQTVDHLLDPNIMQMGSPQAVEARLNAIPGYVAEFNQTFGENALTISNISNAIASFERTLKTPNSPFDQFIKGDENALNAAAKRGYHEFIEVGCMSCHFGVNFAGPAPGPAFKMGDGFYELFPNYLGSQYDDKYDLTSDIGRYQVSLENIHKYMWRVPPMRNVMLTAPYFHNGSVKDIAEAVRVMGLVQLKKQLSEQQVKDIIAFLESLTGEFPEIAMPRLPDTPGQSLIPDLAQ